MPLVKVVVNVPVRRPTPVLEGDVSGEGATSVLLPVAVELEVENADEMPEDGTSVGADVEKLPERSPPVLLNGEVSDDGPRTALPPVSVELVVEEREVDTAGTMLLSSETKVEFNVGTVLLGGLRDSPPVAVALDCSTLEVTTRNEVRVTTVSLVTSTDSPAVPVGTAVVMLVVTTVVAVLTVISVEVPDDGAISSEPPVAVEVAVELERVVPPVMTVSPEIVVVVALLGANAVDSPRAAVPPVDVVSAELPVTVVDPVDSASLDPPVAVAVEMV